MATYLLGPVLGFVLRLRGVVCLHASAIAVDGCAIALLGHGGIGKSTGAAAFAQAGYPVLSDDIVALVDRGSQFLSQPGYPHVRLWPEAAASLFGSADALPRLTPKHPTWDKRFLDLTRDGYRFQDRPLPLAAIYTGERTLDPTAEMVTALPPGQALVKLVANAYSYYLLDKDMRGREFDILSRLARHVPMRWLRARRDWSDLAQLRDAIIADVQQLRR